MNDPLHKHHFISSGGKHHHSHSTQDSWERHGKKPTQTNRFSGLVHTEKIFNNKQTMFSFVYTFDKFKSLQSHNMLMNKHGTKWIELEVGFSVNKSLIFDVIFVILLRVSFYFHSFFGWKCIVFLYIIFSIVFNSNTTT